MVLYCGAMLDYGPTTKYFRAFLNDDKVNHQTAPKTVGVTKIITSDLPRTNMLYKILSYLNTSNTLDMVIMEYWNYTIAYIT